MHSGATPRLLRTVLPVILALAAPLTVSLRAADESTSADELKNQTDRWIDLEKRAADERYTWRTQKEVLTTTIDVLKKERESLQAKLQANTFASGLFRTRVENARGELATQEAAQATMTEKCLALEQRLRALFVRLPEPLQERIRPMLDKLGRATAAEPITVSERTQLLVSSLTAIDQFNNSLTLTHHLRPNAAGETLDIKVLYWGLAAGYAIDANGEHAWLLTPGAAGWEWVDATAHAGEIDALIGVYEKRYKPELVVLPVGREGGAK
jgi:hypothetical protein